MELQCAPDKKEYCQNGEIHIFTVGKYRTQKPSDDGAGIPGIVKSLCDPSDDSGRMFLKVS